MPDYPDHCIRGIREGKHFNPVEGRALSACFAPYEKTAEARDDGCQETSINWEDNDQVLHFTLNYRVNPAALYSFPNGAVRVPKEKIDAVNTYEQVRDSIFYERRAVEGNDYHGNIVFNSGLSKTQISFICTLLAAASSKVYTRNTT
jgi:hypothetical protein